MPDDIQIGEFVLRKETESEQCGMGDTIDFHWHSVYAGEPDPYQGPVAKFKIEQHAHAYIEAANRALTSNPGALN